MPPMPTDPAVSAPGPDGASGAAQSSDPAAPAAGGAGAVLTRSREELAAALGRAPGPRAVVMTMGALHEGHFDLVREAARRVGEAGTVVVTIFVNPLQFAAGEDLDSYPRDLEGDLEGLERALRGPEGALGVGRLVVFAPAPEAIYPDGPPRVRIDPGPMSTVLEGRTRPTHFAGVCQVVLALLHLTSPRWALFGRKDAQQLAIVTAMVEDLAVPVEIVPVDIRREPDGLAMSSRNAYLTAEERRRALALSEALGAGRRASAGGAGPAQVRSAAQAVLDAAPGVITDYVAVVDPATFTDLTGQGPGLPPSSGISGERPGGSGRALLAVAARVGSTRLIDNCLVDLPADRG
ncbi:pantoate--beta-alanine ligase [Actinomyces bowdenii]|nr:pantoate--beta-alanine ligase [Actinomyces bowdenii]